MLTKIIIYYLVLINVGNFLIFAIDKFLAKRGSKDAASIPNAILGNGERGDGKRERGTKY